MHCDWCFFSMVDFGREYLEVVTRGSMIGVSRRGKRPEEAQSNSHAECRYDQNALVRNTPTRRGPRPSFAPNLIAHNNLLQCTMRATLLVHSSHSWVVGANNYLNKMLRPV